MNLNHNKFKVGAAGLSAGRNLFKVGAAAAAITAMGAASGQAQVIFYDGVDYTGATAGTSLSGNYTPDTGGSKYTGGSIGTVQTGGYTYTDSAGNSLVTSGNFHVNQGGYYAGGATTTFPQISTPTFYVSLLGTNGGYQDGNIQLTDSTQTIVVKGGYQNPYYQITPQYPNGQNKLGGFTNIDGAGRSQGGAGVTSTNPIGFYVLQFSYAAGQETITGYVDPTLASQPGVGSAAFSDTLNVATAFTPDTLTFDAQFYSYGLNTDEIRIGDTYSDVTPFTTPVVPEPSTWALMCGGLISLFSFRRIFGRRSTES